MSDYIFTLPEPPDPPDLLWAVVYGQGVMPTMKQVPDPWPVECSFVVATNQHNGPLHPSQVILDRVSFYLETVVDGIPRYNRDRMN